MVIEKVEELEAMFDAIVVELVKDEVTEGGIIIPEQSQKDQLFLKVVAIGNTCKTIKEGDWVMPHPLSRPVLFKLKEKEFVVYKEYEVLTRVRN
jgi:co-chaperonin GroES (HSP10)